MYVIVVQRVGMETPPKYEQKLKMAMPLDQQAGFLSDCMGGGLP